MNAVYLETSALLAWLLAEPREQEVRRALDEAEVVVTSTLTLVEASRALHTAERGNRMREGEARRVRGLLERARAEWVTMAVSEEVLARASRPFPAEPIRTLHAIHLATALEFLGAFPDLRLLSHDRRLRDNAQALGLE